MPKQLLFFLLASLSDSDVRIVLLFVIHLVTQHVLPLVLQVWWRRNMLITVITIVTAVTVVIVII